MAKSLGQIHSVDLTMTTDASGDLFAVDLPGQLTEQLQRTVRAGTYHKLVGIDLTLDTVGTIGGGQLTGEIRYYAPTKGRCEAFRNAFKTMKDTMRIQGIETWTNPLYDFKARATSDTLKNQNGNVLSRIPNQATLNGTNSLCLHDSAHAGSSIFGIHNRNVEPRFTDTTGELFSGGFDTLQSPTGATDFVLNDTIPFTGNHNTASTEYESIPFMISWSPDEGTGDNQNRLSPVSFQWRPDPALYVAIMCGQLELYIEEINVDSGASQLNINANFMVAGWKSIMGNPDKKRSSSSMKKSSSSRK